MLEFIILYTLCKRIGQIARAKGRRAIRYQLMLVLFWFAGEAVAALLAGGVLAFLYGEAFEQYLWFGYIAALAGAAVGAWLAFEMVTDLPEPLVGDSAEPGTTADRQRD